MDPDASSSPSPAGEPPAPLVSVIIPVRDDPERLDACLEALGRQRWPLECLEVIVVDDGSQCDPSHLTQGRPFARLLRQEAATSYAARNRGIREARGEVLAFTDADCLPAPGWIASGVEALGGDSSIGLVGGRIHVVPRDEDEPTAVELHEMRFTFPQEHYVREGGWSVTANLFTRPEVFRTAGLFNASLPSGGDREWGMRVTSFGFRAVYAEDALVEHPARHTWPELKGKIDRMALGAWKIARPSRLQRLLFCWDLLGELVPPLGTLVRILRDRDLGSPKTRLAVCMVVLRYRWAQAAARARLLAGIGAG